jgi:glycosyltransferase involved in cell wall biosynthesis
VEVIKLGLSSQFLSKPISSNIKDNQDSYILYVSRFEKRKNQLELIKAWEDSNSKHQLILIGFEVDGYKKVCTDYCDDKGLNNVIFLQGLSSEELKNYYIHANKIFYLSKSEGFGLPVIEALYLNGKCFFYNNTALKEFTFASNNFIDGIGLEGILKERDSRFKNNNYRKIIDKFYNLDNNIKNYVDNI